MGVEHVLKELEIEGADRESLFEIVEEALMALRWDIKKGVPGKYIEANYGTLFGTGVPSIAKIWLSDSEAGTRLKAEITSRGWKFGALVRRELKDRLDYLLYCIERMCKKRGIASEVRVLSEKAWMGGP